MKPKSSKWLLVTLGLIFTITLLIFTYLIIKFYNQGLKDNGYNLTNNNPESYTTSYSQDSTATQYSKVVVHKSDKTIEAMLPAGYSINLLTDSTGMKYKVQDVEYNGITRLDILNDKQKAIISIIGVSGIGGNTNINTCYSFKDTDRNFLNSIETSKVSPDINYQEFNLFGKLIRFTQDNSLALLFDKFSKEGEVFCNPYFYDFIDINFNLTHKGTITTENLYEVNIDKTISNEILFKILSSLKID